MSTPKIAKFQRRTFNIVKPDYRQIEPHKPMFNIGAGFDVPTGDWVRGIYGETILNGGVAAMTGVVGPGNQFKTTLIDYQSMTFLYRFDESHHNSYDTEINKHEGRLASLAELHPNYRGVNPVTQGRWAITDSSLHLGEEWFDMHKDWLNKKIADRKNLEAPTPFLNREGTGNLMIMMPTSSTVDSLTEFKTKDIVKMADDNSLGDSKANTIFLRTGAHKKRILFELPNIIASAGHVMFMTAHIGDKFKLDPRAPDRKQLQHMSADVKMKGVPESFSFLMNNLWYAYGASVLKNDSTQAPEFPRDPEENKRAGSTDLNTVRLRQLRGKSGQTGFTITVVVSQEEGLKPSLSEFLALKESKRYGFENPTNMQDMSICLMPDVKLGRTTVRGKLDNDPKLRRAVNILHEMLQEITFRPDSREFMPEPKELYQGLKDKGYDWNMLLQTREWWTVYNDDPDRQPFLSMMDLVRMYNDKYVPYWLKPEDVPEKCRHIERSLILPTNYEFEK